MPPRVPRPRSCPSRRRGAACAARRYCPLRRNRAFSRRGLRRRWLEDLTWTATSCIVSKSVWDVCTPGSAWASRKTMKPRCSGRGSTTFISRTRSSQRFLIEYTLKISRPLLARAQECRARRGAQATASSREALPAGFRRLHHPALERSALRHERARHAPRRRASRRLALRPVRAHRRFPRSEPSARSKRARDVADLRARHSASGLAVLGNHDSARMVPRLEAMGIQRAGQRVRDDRAGGESIYVAGVDDAHFYRADNIEKARRLDPARAPSPSC